MSEVVDTVRLGHHDGAPMLGEHREIIGMPIGFGPVDADDHVGATAAQPSVDGVAGRGLGISRDRVFEIEDDRVGAAGGRFVETVWAVAGHKEHAACGSERVLHAVQRRTAGRWLATILSTTSLAVSAHAVVPPLA